MVNHHSSNSTVSSSGSNQTPPRCKSSISKKKRSKRCTGRLLDGTRCCKFTYTKLCWYHEKMLTSSQRRSLERERVITNDAEFDERPFDDWLIPISEYESIEEMLNAPTIKPVDIPDLETLLG